MAHRACSPVAMAARWRGSTAYMPFLATTQRDEVRTRTVGSRQTQRAQKERRREAKMGWQRRPGARLSSGRGEEEEGSRGGLYLGRRRKREVRRDEAARQGSRCTPERLSQNHMLALPVDMIFVRRTAL
jgi:hypothetical protein